MSNNTDRNNIFRTGVLLALGAAIISGISVYVNKFAVSAVSDAVLFTTLKNTFVGVALLVAMVVMSQRDTGARRAWSSLSRREWLGLVGLAVIGGSIPFLLFFTGLKMASAPSAALIQKTLFIWVALLGAPLLGERLGKWTIVGLVVLLIGLLLSNMPKAWGWGLGESLILIATIFWALETLLAKRLLTTIPVSLAATARMAGGALVMWLFLIATNQVGNAFALSLTQWMWVAVTSAILFGYVAMWYTALKFAPATVVTSVLALGAVITVALTSLLEGKPLETPPALGMTLMIVGAAFVTGLWVERRRNVGLVPA